MATAATVTDTSQRTRAPLLAAISLERQGGGVALVARLIWQALTERFGSHVRLVTLLADGQRASTAVGRARFATRIVAPEVLGATDFVLFSHLDLTRVHRVLPSGLRQPYGIFLHGIEAWTDLSDFERRSLRGACVRIANSMFTARRVMDRYPDIGPVSVCPLALPPQVATGRSNAPRAHREWRFGEHMVLAVGRMDQLERYKGHDELIDAWPKVVAAVPTARLVFVGHGTDTGRLRQKAEDMGVGASVAFTGFVSDEQLNDLYAQAALFALPSRGEGFGLVYLEAMSHGLACVGSIHDAAAEVICDAVTGRLVDQSDIDAMGDTLITLLRDADLRIRMGHEGCRRATDVFSFPAFSSRLHSLIP